MIFLWSFRHYHLYTTNLYATYYAKNDKRMSFEEICMKKELRWSVLSSCFWAFSCFKDEIDFNVKFLKASAFVDTLVMNHSKLKSKKLQSFFHSKKAQSLFTKYKSNVVRVEIFSCTYDCGFRLNQFPVFYPTQMKATLELWLLFRTFNIIFNSLF